MKRGPSLTIDAIASHDRACSRYMMVPTPVYFWTLSGIRCGPAGLGEGDNKLACPGLLTVDTVLGMKHWIRFATDDEKNAQCAASEEPVWYRRLEVDGMPHEVALQVVGALADETGMDWSLRYVGEDYEACCFQCLE